MPIRMANMVKPTFVPKRTVVMANIAKQKNAGSRPVIDLSGFSFLIKYMIHLQYSYVQLLYTSYSLKYTIIELFCQAVSGKYYDWVKTELGFSILSGEKGSRPWQLPF